MFRLSVLDFTLLTFTLPCSYTHHVSLESVYQRGFNIISSLVGDSTLLFFFFLSLLCT